MQWISVHERLPDRYVTVLAWAKLGNGDALAGRAYYRSHFKCWAFEDYSEIVTVTHWMPMPHGPDEAAKKH